MSDKFDDVIDPEVAAEALLEAQGKGIQEEVTVLELLAKQPSGSPVKVKVRYVPQSMGSALEFEDGTPIKNERNPKFKASTWNKNILKKLNTLALKNIQIVNDLDGKEPGPREIRLSLISEAEFKRLYGLCFPGASDGSDDSEIEDNAYGGKKRKGLRAGKPDAGGS